MMSDQAEEVPEDEEVKSTAVVKYSLPKPTHFMKLQCNTDLNLPPSNWLNSVGDTYGLQHVFYHPTGFSSFRMAHMFPDCVGEVDVVSDAENIKNLLKIPYCKGQVSMMVHRVENTLLLDDFDIYKYLLRTAETEWEWLKKFFYENIKSDAIEEDRKLYIKSRRRKALEQKSLVSKFLYHSIIDSKPEEQCDNGVESTNESRAVQGPTLPEPSPSEEVPDSSTFDHKFNRNVIWTFEDIEMLIGTDMPIFGGGTHPCISLRLRDMSKPINVLTGIDYWLDNLMSNVPEVVMCYHLNGIVQKYELIKTEDLPRMDNSKFSPKLIRDVAQSILSFLKSNATKAGHTYWLFKGKNEEVVKLYDLTSLCSEKAVNDQNPFTVPVAMLLYRVARNMKHSSDRQQPGTIRMLLKNCIKLLSEEKYPEIVTSSHYMLSDLYVPARTNPECPDLDHMETDEYEPYFEDDDESESKDDLKESATKTLILDSNHPCDKFVNHYKPPPPITGTLEDRCQQAIYHVAVGLSCLKYFPMQDNYRKETVYEEQAPMANPFEPIPMPYSKLNGDKAEKQNVGKKNKKKEKNKKKIADKGSDKCEEKEPCALLLKGKAEAQPLPTWQNPVDMDNISWKQHLKTLLYEKGILVYAILAEYYYGCGNYGHSMRVMGLLVRCKQVLEKLTSSNSLCDNTILGRAGDCCVMMVQKWANIDTYKDQFNTHSEEDIKMIEQLQIDEEYYGISASQSQMECVINCTIDTIEHTLQTGVQCYEQALKSCETDSMLLRLGNVLNEVASYYLNRARAINSPDDIVALCEKAEINLKRALEAFEKAKNESNMALLYTNMGHLHRLLAHTNTPSDRGELTAKEKIHYNKSFINYKKALQVLGGRSYAPGIWDAVTWELSTALFTMASIMHEHPNPSLTKAEAEREVIEVLQRALQYCDLNEENPRFPLYQYRAAVIHLRLASLYHNHVRSSDNDIHSNKNIIQLARINYDKASHLFLLSMDTVNFLTSQMQHFALLESLADNSSATHVKIKYFMLCLQILMEIKPMLQLIVEKKIEVPQEDLTEVQQGQEQGSFNNYQALLNLVKQRLQYVLRNLTKLSITKSGNNKEMSCDTYKACYATALTVKDGLGSYELAEQLKNILEEIDQKLKSCKSINL